ncbi:MAG: cytochrome c [Planctomycetia bacterium]|nr:cytochrome c [Planctomycetia bacterium]
MGRAGGHGPRSAAAWALLMFVCLAAWSVAAEPGPGPQAWPERIGNVSAGRFWQTLEDGGLLPTRSYPSFWRTLTAEAGRDLPGRAGVLAALDAALAAGDLRDGPHVEMLDYEGSHVLGEPQIHSVHGFQNESFDVWFLLTRTFSEAQAGAGPWDQWAIVQDKRVEPHVATFFHYAQGSPEVSNARNCYRCHANGPRALDPARPDLVSGREYLAEVNDYCRSLVGVVTDFDGPRPDFGAALDVADCTGCHATGADRGPLHRIQAHAIRAAVARGRMPPDGPLSREGAIALEAFLRGPPEEAAAP